MLLEFVLDNVEVKNVIPLLEVSFPEICCQSSTYSKIALISQCIVNIFDF